MPRFIWDFETASACSLKEAGAAAYAQHVTTEVLCLVWKREGGNRHGVWSPWLPELADTAELHGLVAQPENRFVSHASFEQFIWLYHMTPLYGMPPIPIDRWDDTQAVAAWRSMPLALDKLLKVME
jgi:hypothetical protein